MFPCHDLSALAPSNCVHQVTNAVEARELTTSRVYPMEIYTRHSARVA